MPNNSKKDYALVATLILYITKLQLDETELKAQNKDSINTLIKRSLKLWKVNAIFKQYQESN